MYMKGNLVKIISMDYETSLTYRTLPCSYSLNCLRGFEHLARRRFEYFYLSDKFLFLETEKNHVYDKHYLLHLQSLLYVVAYEPVEFEVLSEQNKDG